jgi:hypothetical protein
MGIIEVPNVDNFFVNGGQTLVEPELGEVRT